MAVLDNLLGTDTFDIVETKIDAAIDVVNATVGGTTGQVLTKASGTDFDYSFEDPDGQARVSATDTGLAYLSGKITNGPSISITIVNPGAFETMLVEVANEGLSTPTPVNNWTFSGTPRYSKDGCNTVRVAAVAVRSGDETDDTVFTLAAGSRPAQDKAFTSMADDGTVRRIAVLTTGDVNVINYSSVGSYTVPLDVIQFRTDM